MKTINKINHVGNTYTSGNHLLSKAIVKQLIVNNKPKMTSEPKGKRK